MRVVIDTGVWISHLLNPVSVAGLAFAKAQKETVILLSSTMLEEYSNVVFRAKFASFINPEEIEIALKRLIDGSEAVLVTASIKACRDPNDDKVLSLAVSGKADFIITGDNDLLVLHPFHGISIVTPRQFLENGI